MLSGIFIVREANIHLPQPEATVYTQEIIQRQCTLKCKKRCGKSCTERSSYDYSLDELCSPDSRSNIMNEKKQTDSICRASAWFEYGIRVPYWSNPSSFYSFSPNQTVFDQTKTGIYLDIPVHQGAAGIEWVDIDTIWPQSR